MKFKNAASIVLITLTASLSGCGNSPGSDDAKTAVTSLINNAQRDKFGISVTLGSWSRKPDASDDQHLIAKWSADVTFPEAYGYLAMQVNNRNIVHVAVKNGGTVTLQGAITAEKTGERWLFDIPTGDPWAEFRNRLAIPAAYNVVNGDNVDVVMRRGTAENGCPIDALSTFNNPVLWDSDEGKKIVGDVESQIKTADAARARQELAATQKAALNQQEKAEEKQQKAAAREPAAFVAPLLKPFQGTSGLVIAAAAGNAMGWFITDSSIDPANNTITGKGLNLQQMPFAPFTFQATPVPGRRQLDITISTSDTPLHLSPVGAKGALSDGTYDTAVLDAAARADLDQLVILGQRLGTAPPLALQPEILTAAAAIARQAEFQTIPLAGIITHQGKKTANYDGLFAGKVAGLKVFTWKNETLAIRLSEVVSGRYLYIKGSAADSQAAALVINGVHTVKIDSIPKAGGMLLPLPPDLQILDLRVEAQGNFQTRGIMLFK